MKKSSKSLLMCMLITGICAGNAQGAFAEEKISEFNLDQMVVTASRIAESNFEANANVNVVTRKDIEEKHYQTVSEALRAVPGVAIQNYSATGANYSADYLYVNGTSHVLVLVDGQRANTNGSVSSVFQPSEVSNMDNIERIEVLKGSASTLYGSDAKGGVINIITKKPEKISTYFRVDGGSNSITNYYMGQSGKEKDWSWDANVSRNLSGDFKDGDGITTPSSSKSTSTNFKITKKLSDKHELTATYDSYKADYKYTALWEPALKNGKVDNQNYKFILNSNFDGNTTNVLSFVNLDNDTDFNGYKTKTNTKRITDQLSTQLGNHLLTAGFEFSHDKVITFNGKKMMNRAFFLQDQFDITDQLKLTAGVRHDNNSGFGKHTTPSANLGYTFNKDRTNKLQRVFHSAFSKQPLQCSIRQSEYQAGNR